MFTHRRDRCLARCTLAGLGLTVALVLPACTANPLDPPNPPGSYATAEIFNDPSEVQTDMFFQPNSGALASGEAARINRELRSLLLRPGDDIVVTLPSTGIEVIDARREATARTSVAGTPARVRIVTRRGFPLAASERKNAGLIQIQRFSKVRVVCPNQGRDFIDDRFGRSELTMGCINAANIASMVAEPRVLTAPGALRGSDGIAAADAVERYRTDNIKQPGRLRVLGD